MKYQNIFKIALSLTCLAWFTAMNSSYAADNSPMAASHRAEKWQAYFSLNDTQSSTIDFNGGTTLDVNGDIGWLFGIGYNFDEHLALDFELGWNSLNYKANLVGLDTRGGWMDTSSTRFNLTYNFMATRLTPFIAGNIGWTWIDSNIPSAPATGGCYFDPWYGYICSSYQPTYAKTEFSYGGSLGVRYDLNDTVFMRGSVNKQWLDISQATSTPAFTSYRFDIGLLFR